MEQTPHAPSRISEPSEGPLAGRTALLSTTFFGPVEWFEKIARYPHVLIEKHDSYQKQTFRNRCVIATESGRLPLSVPVTVDSDGRVLVSDHGQWRRHHWNALQTAYGDSPFFEFYEDDIREFFTPGWETLYELNDAILRRMCSLLDLRPCIGATDEFLPEPPAYTDDFRSSIHPKHPSPSSSFAARPYYQVYASRHGFLPNLSILDLLFCEGPQAVLFLV